MASEAAKSLATSVRKGEVAPFRLAMDSSVPVQLVVEMLSVLRDTFEGLELTLGTGTRLSVIRDALDGGYDLVIVAHAGGALGPYACLAAFPRGLSVGGPGEPQARVTD